MRKGHKERDVILLREVDKYLLHDMKIISNDFEKKGLLVRQ